MMADDSEHMLTTVDNPWNPFTNYQEWYEFDHAQGYDTPGLLARIANISLDVSDADFELSIEQTMNEIVNLNVTGMHILVTKPAATA
jgi:hypothetical protein